MSQKLIRAALESRLATWAAARVPALPIAYENTTGAPALPCLRTHLLPARTTSDTLEGTHRAYRGVFQVAIVVPIGAGPALAETIAGELADLFPVNLRLPNGAITVQVTGPASAAPALQHESDFTVPVSLPYRTDTN